MRWRLVLPTLLVTAIILCCFASCSKSDSGGNPVPPVIPPVVTPGTNDVEMWVTTASQLQLLQKQSDTLSFGTTSNANPYIDVDSTQTYQTIDGFGYTLTGGSATLINQLNPATKTALLQELFGNSGNAIGVSYLRISIGASDLSASVFSYDDLPAGQTDVNLDHFSLSLDTVDLVPLLKQILLINPKLKILGSPWSPPVWMKDNASSIAGGLLPQYYAAYANYFVKYVQAMKANGISIDAVTIQNEPENGGNNPSMFLAAVDEASFVKNNLGPAFQAAGLQTKIIIWDHNCDDANYPLTILSDAVANPFVDGSAFHLYAGDISALSTVHYAFPTKNLYFTEQYTGANGSFSGDFMWHIKNVIIGSMRNWSKNALEWNLASDPSSNPHTVGGCSNCKGAITIGATDSYARNVAYYNIAQIAKFVPAGSVRIGSTLVGSFSTAAFLTPSGKKVMLVLNEATIPTAFNLRYSNKWVKITLPGSSAGTFIW